MIGSIGSGYPSLTAVRTSVGRTSNGLPGGAGPSPIFSLPSVEASGTVAATSSAKPSGPVLNDSFFKQAYAADQATRSQMWSDAAKAVSASQGLAEGKYDFSRMTPAQALVVMNDRIVNQGGDPNNETMGINLPPLDAQGYQGASWQSPMDFIGVTKDALSFASAGGYTNAAENYRRALDFMSRVGGLDSKNDQHGVAFLNIYTA